MMHEFREGDQKRFGRAIPRERLSGGLAVDCEGEPRDPGDALPFDLSEAPPTMLAPRELSYLHWLGSQTTGAGRVVELGCFLGGSTAALADGRLRSAGSGSFLNEPMLVYDSFEAPADTKITDSWWMKPFGLKAGEDFLPAYRRTHSARWGALDVRKGWIPGGGDRDARDAVYPERHPIELLFIDAAKTWETHVTILQTFASRLVVGGVLVQQDFMDLLPWLTVHMWELRSCFEPLDLVRGTPTLSFRCISDPRSAIESLTTEPGAFLRSESGPRWNEIKEYWREVAPGVFDGVLASHACLLAIQKGQYEEAIAHAERYEVWEATVASHQVYRSAFWDGWLERLELSTDGDGASAAAIRVLRACRMARRMMPSKERDHGGALYLGTRHEAWRRAASVLKDQGVTRLALYGGGQHTRWILGADGPLARGSAPFDVVCVIDDAPKSESIEGVPVLRPEQLGNVVPTIEAVVPSSDAHESRILKRIEAVFGSSDQIIVPLYTRIEAVRDQEERPATRVNLPPRQPRASELEASARHRVRLGLDSERSWLPAFAESYIVPDWAVGYVNHQDSLLLWDLVEAVRPRLVVEIGVASGVSTVVLASAMDAFGPETARLLSVDLAERCYFDEEHRVGEALTCASLRARRLVELLPEHSAIDACKRVPGASVELAFIDGDHRHPAPTLDLIALLPALAPGAWVALHDIELPEIARMYRNEFGGATGAHQLFHGWPFEKVQPISDTPALKNIGAIRMPQNPQAARSVLVDLLRESWEIGSPGADLARAIEPVTSVITRPVVTSVEQSPG